LGYFFLQGRAFSGFFEKTLFFRAKKRCFFRLFSSFFCPRKRPPPEKHEKSESAVFDHAKGGGFGQGENCMSIFTSVCTGSGRDARPSSGGDFSKPCAHPHGEQKKRKKDDKTPLKTGFFCQKAGRKSRVFQSEKFPPRF
jgi:hypothetical protein